MKAEIPPQEGFEGAAVATRNATVYFPSGFTPTYSQGANCGVQLAATGHGDRLGSLGVTAGSGPIWGPWQRAN